MVWQPFRKHLEHEYASFKEYAIGAYRRNNDDDLNSFESCEPGYMALCAGRIMAEVNRR
jgi:hypothetical protein